MEGSGTHGVVVVSMGTTLGFDEERTRDIAGALSLLRQRVVWILRDPLATSLGNNTRTVPWLALNDVLGWYPLLLIHWNVYKPKARQCLR